MKTSHTIASHFKGTPTKKKSIDEPRVSIQGVKSLGGHFACLCRGVEFYEVKKRKILLLFFKKKMEILLHFLSFL